MKKILVLTKVFLKNSFKLNYNKQNTDVKIRKKVITYLLIGLLVVYLAGIFGFMSYELVKMLMEFNQEALFLGVLLLAIAGLTIFQTIFSTINIFYFSKDVEYVLPLPLRPWQIIAAKFNTLIIVEYFTEMLFVLAPLIVYGVLTAASPMFYVFGFLVLLMFPILPAMIMALLVMIIMSFAKFTKNRDMFQVVVAILAIVLVIGMQFLINNTGEYTEEEMLEVVTKANGVVGIVTKYFPTIEPSLDSMLEPGKAEGLIGFSKLLGMTAAGYIIFILIGNKIYLRGAVGNSENGGSNKKFVAGTRIYKQKKAGVTYFLKEMRILFRNPIYFIQCVLPVILIPVLFLVIFLNGGSSSDPEIRVVVDALRNAEVESIIFGFIIIGIIHFLFMVSYSTITAISRDGKNAIFMKQIPISLYKQFIYKMMPGMIFSIVQIIIVLGTVLYIFPSVSILFILTIFVLSLILAIFQNYLYLMVDLRRPKLEWDSEMAVVKQNMNMIFQFGIIFLICGILALIAFLLKDIEISVYIVSYVISAITIIGIFTIDRYIRKNQEKLFEKIV